MKLDIYYSYACRDSYLAFAWLKQVEKLGQALDIHWHPFAIQTDEWVRSWAEANSELRGFIAAGAAALQGKDAFLRFHAALEVAVHEQFLELGDEATLIGAAQIAELDLNRFQKDWHDSHLVEAAQRSHTQAVEQWNVSGTPTIVFDDRYSIHLELSKMSPDAAGLETFRALEKLTITYPYIVQFKTAYSTA